MYFTPKKNQIRKEEITFYEQNYKSSLTVFFLILPLSDKIEFVT